MSIRNPGILRSILGAILMLVIIQPATPNGGSASVTRALQLDQSKNGLFIAGADAPMDGFDTDPVPEARGESYTRSGLSPAAQAETITTLGWWRQGTTETVTYDAPNSLVYVGAGGSILVMDVSGGGDPQQLAIIETPTQVGGMTVANGLLYVANRLAGLRIYDVSTPASPQSLSFVSYEDALSVQVSNGYAFVATTGQGVRILDVSNPASPQEVSSISGTFYITDMDIKGQWLYLVYWADNPVYEREEAFFTPFDISNPAAPAPAGTYELPRHRFDNVVVSGNYAYLLDRDTGTYTANGLRILDISNPSLPASVTFFDITAYYPSDLFVHDNLVLLSGGGNDTLRILDVSNISVPVQVGSIMLTLHGFAMGSSAATAGGDLAYLATGAGGLRIVSIADPAHLVEVGASDPTPWLSSLVPYGPYLYATSADQTYIFSVTDPAEPTKVAGFGPYSTDQITIAGDLAYVVNVYGMRIFSLADPLDPVEVGRYEAPDFVPLTVMIDGNIAYVRADPYDGPEPDLVVFDISDPTEPTIIGSLTDTHLGIRRTTFYNQHLYVLDNGERLIIIDVSTPSAPVVAGAYGAECSGAMRGIGFSGNYAFVRDAYCSETEWYPKLIVLDLSVPSAPTKVAELDIEGGVGDWVTVVDDRIFLTGGGMDLINISNPLSPQYIGSLVGPMIGGEITLAGYCIYSRNLGFTTLQYSNRTCLPAPVLLAPANHAQVGASFPVFDWEDVSAADHYEFQLALEKDFESPTVSEVSLSTSEYQPAITITADERYYWRVRAVDAAGYQSEWSVIRSVVSYANTLPTSPVPGSPAANALVSDYTPNLTWSKIVMPPGAIFGHYQIQVGEENTFSDPIVDWGIYNIDVTSYTVPTELTPNRTYYWRIQVYNDLEQPGPWSAARTFRTQIVPPELLSPAYAEHLQSTCHTFDWTDVDGASSYRIQLSQNPSTWSPLLFNVTSTSSSLARCSLPTGGITIYWRVQANGANGPSSWSIFTGFYAVRVPTLSSPANNMLDTSYSPLLDWNDIFVPNGTEFKYYRVQTATNATFTADLMEYTTSEGMVTESSLHPIPDLMPNKRYYWRVRAENMDGQSSAWSASRYFRTAMLAPTPAEPLDTASIDSKRPTLQWMGVVGASSYTVEASLNENFSTKVFSVTVSSTSYTRTLDLLPNKLYYWRVRANGLNGPSLYSAVRSFTTGNPPAIPVLSAPASNMLVTNYSPLLDWNTVTVPNGTQFARYRVQIATDAGFTSDPVELTTTENLVTDSSIHPSPDLIPNKRYYWRVRAENTDGQHSAWSASRYFRTAMLPPALGEPLDAASIDSKRPTLQWTGVEGASSYTVEAALSQSFATRVFSVTVSSTGYTRPADLAPNKLYYWRVRANGLNGPSLYSEVHSFTTGNPPAIPVLSAPASNVLVTNYSPLLDWSNVTAPAGTEFKYYRVQTATNSAFTTDLMEYTTVEGLVSDSSLSPVPSLAPNKKFYWRVRAENTDGQYSAWSASRYFRTALTPPASLTPGSVIPEPAVPVYSRHPTFSWEPAPDAAGYTVEYSTAPTFATKVSVSTTKTSLTPAADLLANKVYYWRVKATGTNGPGAPSQVRTFMTGNPPTTPVLSSPATGTLLSSPVLLNWANSTVPAGTSFDHYQIQVATDNAFDNIIHDNSLPGLSNSQDNTAPLAAGTTYYWRVCAWNIVNGTESHSSAWSAVRSVRIKYDPPTLELPANPATAISRMPTFEWNDTTGATSYTLQVSTSPSFGTFVINRTLTSSTYTHLTNLLANKTYYWRVRINGSHGPSNWSAVFTFTTTP